jgi:hypothetical protein
VNPDVLGFRRSNRSQGFRAIRLVLGDHDGLTVKTNPATIAKSVAVARFAEIIIV